MSNWLLFWMANGAGCARCFAIERHLIDDLQITNLANASSLIFNALQAFPLHFGPGEDKAVNWCG